MRHWLETTNTFLLNSDLNYNTHQLYKLLCKNAVMKFNTMSFRFICNLAINWTILFKNNSITKVILRLSHHSKYLIYVSYSLNAWAYLSYPYLFIFNLYPIFLTAVKLVEHFYPRNNIASIQPLINHSSEVVVLFAWTIWKQTK